MPNDCWNHMTIKATNEQIRQILTVECRHLPDWVYVQKQVGRKALAFRIWSRWDPDVKFMTHLFDKYPGIWIKNIWDEEGGAAGVIVGTKDNVTHMKWQEGCIEEWADRYEEDDTMPAAQLHQT
jgi:hypothetical protein